MLAGLASAAVWWIHAALSECGEPPQAVDNTGIGNLFTELLLPLAEAIEPLAIKSEYRLDHRAVWFSFTAQ